MGAALIIRKGISWLPQRLTFDEVLTLIVEEFEPSNFSLASQVRAPIGNYPYLDVEPMDALQFRTLLEATTQAYERQASAWTQGQPTPASDPFLMYALSELKALMRLDERAGEQPTGKTGKITVRDHATWEVVCWVYDLALEIIAGWIQERDPFVTGLLLNSRTSKASICNLSSINAAQFHLFVEPMDMFRGRYMERQMTVGHSPKFTTDLLPSIATLYQLFRTDPRVSNEDWPDYEGK